MKGRLKTGAPHLLQEKVGGGLRWVILLLAVAVILPTVCILWFITKAVENVRLAARQRLINLYEERLERAAQSVGQRWQKRAAVIVAKAEEKPVRLFSFVLQDESTVGRLGSGIVIYEASGEAVYPIIGLEQTSKDVTASEFEGAWRLEFLKKDYAEAIKLYRQIADSAKSNFSWRKAVMAKARCFKSLGDFRKAAEVCNEAGYSKLTGIVNRDSISLAAQARVFLVDLNRQAGMGSKQQLNNLFETATAYSPSDSNLFLPMESATRIFILEKAIEKTQISPYPEQYVGGPDAIKQVQKVLNAEKVSLQVAKYYPTAGAFEQWQNGAMHRLEMPGGLYGLFCKSEKRFFLLVNSAEFVEKDFNIFTEIFREPGILWRVLDDKGNYFGAIEHPKERPFLTLSDSDLLASWKVEIFITANETFEIAAKRQTALYIWTGVLVITLIIVVGGFAGRVVGRQIKLNRLKNDFIATVSHELKTPLSSMRVLVDTLLEGRYSDQQQAEEYLRLTAKENERLSRLIDNFLTFSRMERNKQAFDIVETAPAEIAESAVEAVRTKFNHRNCKFIVTIDDNLPSVMADKDAMITVLVNLLDNAYKYTYDNKQIELKVFRDNNFVCFSVWDNGIGMTRRQMKKVFERFYQADSTLARRTEGAGLGLSIVKFIVDAHKGKIDVQSKPGKGSKFIVKIPGDRHER